MLTPYIKLLILQKHDISKKGKQNHITSQNSTNKVHINSFYWAGQDFNVWINPHLYFVSLPINWTIHRKAITGRRKKKKNEENILSDLKRNKNFYKNLRKYCIWKWMTLLRVVVSWIIVTYRGRGVWQWWHRNERSSLWSSIEKHRKSEATFRSLEISTTPTKTANNLHSIIKQHRCNWHYRKKN